MIKFKNSEITPENIYKKRRSFIKSIGLGASTLAMSTIPFVNKSLASERDKLTSYKDITTYNNYYEFGTSKSDPHRNSQIFKTTPWEIAIEGEVEKPLEAFDHRRRRQCAVARQRAWSNRGRGI